MECLLPLPPMVWRQLEAEKVLVDLCKLAFSAMGSIACHILTHACPPNRQSLKAARGYDLCPGVRPYHELLLGTVAAMIWEQQ